MKQNARGAGSKRALPAEVINVIKNGMTTVKKWAHWQQNMV